MTDTYQMNGNGGAAMVMTSVVRLRAPFGGLRNAPIGGAVPCRGLSIGRFKECRFRVANQRTTNTAGGPGERSDTRGFLLPAIVFDVGKERTSVHLKYRWNHAHVTFEGSFHDRSSVDTTIDTSRRRHEQVLRLQVATSANWHATH